MENIQDELDRRKKRLGQLSRLDEGNKESANKVEVSIQSVESKEIEETHNHEIVSNTGQTMPSQKNYQDSLDCSLHDETTMMRQALQEPLDELDRRTEETIKRLVRQKFISDAIHHE